jgi:small-conductance mechanosensitive channel
MLQEPKAFVVQTALSDFYVEYRLVCYAGPEAPQRRAMVLDALHANIQDVFNEHGVQIMSPHYMMDPPQPQVVPKDKWYEPPAVRPDSDRSAQQNT